jgi:hypothetical protein
MAIEYKRALSSSVGTSPVTIHTAAAGKQTIVLSLSLAAITNTSIQATVTLNTVSNGSARIVYNVPVITGSTNVVLGSPHKLVLQPGDTLTVTSNVASSVDAILSYVEQ